MNRRDCSWRPSRPGPVAQARSGPVPPAALFNHYDGSYNDPDAYREIEILL